MGVVVCCHVFFPPNSYLPLQLAVFAVANAVESGMESESDAEIEESGRLSNWTLRCPPRCHNVNPRNGLLARNVQVFHFFTLCDEKEHFGGHDHDCHTCFLSGICHASAPVESYRNRTFEAVMGISARHKIRPIGITVVQKA